jgi:hypothetical protein
MKFALHHAKGHRLAGDDQPELIVVAEDDNGIIHIRGSFPKPICASPRQAIRLAAYLLRAAGADRGIGDPE